MYIPILYYTDANINICLIEFRPTSRVFLLVNTCAQHMDRDKSKYQEKR